MVVPPQRIVGEVGEAETLMACARGPEESKLKGKNLLIPAAAVFFSLDATSGLLATASASPAMFLALRSALLCVCV